MGLDQVGQDQRSLGQWGIGITSKYLSLTCVKYLRQALYFLTLPWVIRDNTKVRFVRLYSNFGFQSENSLYRAVRHKKVSPLARLFLCLTLQKNGFPIGGDSGLEGSFCQGWLCFYSKFFWDVGFYSDLTYCTYILIRAILRYIWKYCWLLKCTLHPLPGEEFLLEIILVCVWVQNVRVYVCLL